MSSHAPVTGIILAGGSSQRMGRDKAQLPWGGTTLLQHVIDILRPAVDEVLVIVKRAGDVEGLNARVLEDCVPDAHALGGLLTGLRSAAHTRCFVCACDAPFLNPRLVRFLCDQLDGVDLVIPNTDEGLQPLHAAYARTAASAISEQLRQRCWNLRSLVPKVRARIIEPAQWRPLDPEGRSFINLNTPAAYAAASQLTASV